jgi:hypothetical protein
MAEDTNTILGDINPVPAARDHMPGPAEQSDRDDEDREEQAGSHDVEPRTTGNAGTEVGGTRNYRTGTGFTGGDIGNRPE